jgi:hypothetical protein
MCAMSMCKQPEILKRPEFIFTEVVIKESRSLCLGVKMLIGQFVLSLPNAGFSLDPSGDSGEEL